LVKIEEKKQIPFRYPESLEEDFKELFKWQSYTKKKNEAIIDAIEISAKLSRVIEPFREKGSYYTTTKGTIEDLIQQLKKISKNKVLKKDIKNLDLKK